MRKLWSDFYAEGYDYRAPFLGRDGAKWTNFTTEAWEALERVLEITGYGKANIVSTYNVRNIAGTDVPSLHSYSGVALDIDPAQNPFIKGSAFSWKATRFTKQQIDAVYRIKTVGGKRVWRWGGDSFGSESHDYMHFQLDLSPDDLAEGVDWDTVRAWGPPQEMFEPSWNWGFDEKLLTVYSNPKGLLTKEEFIEILHRGVKGGVF